MLNLSIVHDRKTLLTRYATKFAFYGAIYISEVFTTLQKIIVKTKGS